MTTKPRETLEERVARMGIDARDCRSCKMFTPSPTGLGFGWCKAHEQYVKLYHGEFFSQCQFKILSRVTAGAVEAAPLVTVESVPPLTRDAGPVEEIPAVAS